jgi:hypothetical protein
VAPVSAGALEAVDRILNRGGDADDVLRAVVSVLVERGGCTWAGILFAEGEELTLGPEAGSPQPERRIQLPVAFQGTPVAELAADGCDDRAFLERVALIISPYCLVGWDTGGVPWDPSR